MRLMFSLDDKDGAALGLEVANHVIDLVDNDGSEPERGLVDEHDPACRHQAPTEREHTPLSARQRTGGLALTLLQTRENLEDALQSLTDFTLGREVGTHGEVLQDSQVRENEIALRDVNHPSLHNLVRPQTLDRSTVQSDVTTHDGDQRRDRP